MSAENTTAVFTWSHRCPHDGVIVLGLLIGAESILPGLDAAESGGRGVGRARKRGRRRGLIEATRACTESLKEMAGF